MLSFTSIYSVLLVFLTRELRLTPPMVGVDFTAGNIGAVIGALAARAAGMRIRPVC